MTKAKIFIGFVIISLLAVIGGACTPLGPTSPPSPAPSPLPAPTPPLSGTLTVYVTDAPPRDEVTSINVTISEVQIHQAVAEQEREQERAGSDNETEEEVSDNVTQEQVSDNRTQEQEGEREQQRTQQGEGKWISIDLSDNATTFDLLKIKGIEQFLGSSNVTAGKYTQVRLVVDSIKVALGNQAPQDAEVPSKELKLVHPFDVSANGTTALVLDFDADKMVTVTGAGKIIVKPVIKLTTKQISSKGKPGETEKQGARPPEENSQGKTSEQETIKVSYDDFMKHKNIRQEIEVKAGDSFKVILSSNPTTGFQWSETANISVPGILEQVSHELVPPAQTGAVGAPGQEIWTFKALKAGTSTISLEYSRPWQGGEKREWTFEMTVLVK